MSDDIKRVVFAVALSMLAIGAWEYFFPSSPKEPSYENTKVVKESIEVVSNQQQEYVVVDKEQAISSSSRVAIESNVIKGSIDLKGAVLDHIELINYDESMDGNNHHMLLNPKNSAGSYYVQTGWSSANNKDFVPDSATVWKTQSTKLTPHNPVVLYWVNKVGVRFEKHIYLDEHYLITVKDKVINNTDNSITARAWSLVNRSNVPPRAGNFIFHEGGIGVLSGEIEEVSYKSMRKKGKIEFASNNQWMGFSDNYWLVSIMPEQLSGRVKYSYYVNNANVEKYQADYTDELAEVAPRQTIEKSYNVFAGPKEYSLLKMYQEQLNLEHFDLAIDFGIFYFITKPFLNILSWLYASVGNFGIAILLLTIIIRSAMFPLAYKSLISMAKLKNLQPKMQSLKAAYAGDSQRYNKALMELYKSEKVNPVSGCFPVLLQIPVFFAIYKVIYIDIQMRHAPFFGYLKDLSVADPTSIFNLFGLIPIDLPQFLNIGVLPILMGLTMFLQQKLSTQVTDPIQRRVFTMMPFVFTVLLAGFPAGLVLYWVFSNIFSILQQLLVNKKALKKFA